MNQVQTRINQLTSQFDKVSEQLDQASQQLSSAQSRLAQVKVHLNHADTQFQAAQANVAQTAAAAFEDTGSTSMAGVLTSNNASVILQQGSLLMELSGTRNAQTRQLLNDASQLQGVEQEMQRTELGIASLKNQLTTHKNSLSKLIDTEKSTLASLTQPEQQTVQNNSVGGNGSHGAAAVHRLDSDSGRKGGRVRVRSARLSLCLRRDRPMPQRLRLFRASPGGLGCGGRVDTARHL